MTLDEARALVGCGVVYTPGHGPREDGVITSVTDRFVFVRYAGDTTSKATAASDIEPLTGRGKRS